MSNDLPPLGQSVPDAVMAYVHAYGDSRADEDGLSALRIGETVLALRRWAAQLQAAERARHRLDVHSCHQGCAVAGCVNERLRAELAEAKRALQQATEQTQQPPVP